MRPYNQLNAEIKKEKIDPVINEYYIDIFKKFLSNDKIEFSNDMQGDLQNISGVYRIIEKSGNGSEQTIYIGESSDLQRRLYSDLLKGNSKSHTLIKKLIKKGLYANAEGVKMFLKSKCSCQFQIIKKERERKFFEHFAISIFRPTYND